MRNSYSKNLTKIAQNHSKTASKFRYFPSIPPLYRQNPASKKTLCAKFSTLYKQPAELLKQKLCKNPFWILLLF
jgi:hypothetical protein